MHPPPTLARPAWLSVLLLTAAFAAETSPASTNGTASTGPLDSILGGLKPRLLGPAFPSGRVADFAVNPANPAHRFAAVASGGVWKTVNGGATWTPVFDDQGAYSIGCVAMDPRNPNVVWVGTGENNSQRSVGFGDGVYVTRDGGRTWHNTGLKDSEHIGRIVIHPVHSQTVYVAAQGPLWRPGGDRGLYKTPDGGKTWERLLHVGDETGINEVHLDPRDPDVLYASAYQRRRHVWTLVNGGPESALYKSADGGQTWRKLTNGIPAVDKGRIGLAVSPVQPDLVYAIIEAADGKGGFFRSTDAGEHWERRSSYMTTSPQYYNELIPDPQNPERLYAVDTFTQVTEDGGKTFKRVPGKDRHVDDHALWINPARPDHLLVGGDGGIYESHDRGETWRFFENLPVTQYYRVSADNAVPFYNVYGGTQDNNSHGGPSRTTDRAGITSEHWFVTVGGDGYETLADAQDTNILYCLWQYGGLVRHDRRSGEVTDIKPREGPGEPALKWNWDSPLIQSPHQAGRLYFAAHRLFRSEDRGNRWTAISGDLTRGIDRNALPVMGRVQSVDAVARHNSTSFYGNAVALSESPLQEGLLWVGTDDGLVHVTTDGGRTWRKIESFPGVPERTYVSCLTASPLATNTVFAAFENHKNGDFKPYLLRSDDLGQTWTSIAGNLPARDFVLTVQQDHGKPGLLFAGTEFGAWVTLDGGKRWAKIRGLPVIAVRDLEIQRRENDLILGTFGRGIYVLDDYSVLRHVAVDQTNQAPRLFPVKDAWRYVERSRLGNRSGRGSQGATYYGAPNPLFGAVFTYALPAKLTTLKERRQEAEKKDRDAGKAVRQPSFEELQAEQQEKEPQVFLEVRDDSNRVVRRVPASRDKGLHRVPWDLRHPSSEPVQLRASDERPPWEEDPSGPLALPGRYTVTLVKEVDGVVETLAEPQSFQVVPLEFATFAAKDKAAVEAFQLKVARLQRAVEGALRVTEEADTRLQHLRKAVRETPAAETRLLADVEALQDRLTSLRNTLRGDPTYGKHEIPQPPSIRERVSNIVGSQWRVTAPPTDTEQDAYRIAGEAFAQVLASLETLIGTDLKAFEDRLEAAGAPWTPGRLPRWKME